MAELDYAYLAEFAQITDGKLTAVNASFVNVHTELPTMFQFAVAGRVRAPAAVETVEVAITLTTPDENTIVWQADLTGGNQAVYQGKIGMLFALRVAVPMSTHGLYRVKIDIDGQEARRLAFEALPPP